MSISIFGLGVMISALMILSIQWAMLMNRPGFWRKPPPSDLQAPHLLLVILYFIGAILCEPMGVEAMQRLDGGVPLVRYTLCVLANGLSPLVYATVLSVVLRLVINPLTMRYAEKLKETGTAKPLQRGSEGRGAGPCKI